MNFDDLLESAEEPTAVYAVYRLATALLSSGNVWIDDDDSEVILPTTAKVRSLTRQLRDRITASRGVGATEQSGELVRDLSNGLLRRLSRAPAISRLDGASIFSELSSSIGAAAPPAQREEPVDRSTTRPVATRRRSASSQATRSDESDFARALEQEIDHAARATANVLITGESGTGKELVARRIHERSARAQAPLLTVNAAALPDWLLETELFGQVRGSFVGALRDRTGVLKLAHRGTIFMDEIGETTPRMQGLLLRFLETGEIQRVGSERTEARVDVRVIAATNRKLLDRVAAGTFREDLYYRLNVIQLDLPPLRERLEDVSALLSNFLTTFAAQYQMEVPLVASDAMAVLKSYEWPGNIRELKNLAERLVVSSRNGRIELADLPAVVLRPASALPAAPSANHGTVDLLYERMVRRRESFWSAAVYPSFMSRDLTRDDLRGLVRKGLEQTSGSYRRLTQLFNMPADDYKRFLNFLNKQHCVVSLRSVGTAGSVVGPRVAPVGTEEQSISRRLKTGN